MKRTRPFLVSAAALLLLVLAAGTPGEGRPAAGDPGLVDSARHEMRLGRYWHASRLLRAASAHRGGAEETLLLARADAGWSNWPAVVELLEGKPWLDDESGGEGWRLLARALEEQDRGREAADAYGRYLEHAPEPADRDEVVGRMALAWARGGNPVGALDALDGLSPDAAVVESWVAVAMASAATEEGDTALVSVLLGRIVESDARAVAWRFLPEARLAAGDSVGAEAAYRGVLRSGVRAAAAEARIEAGRLTLARGDTAAARDLLLAGLDDASLRGQARGAAALLAVGGTDLGLTVRLARIFDRAGDGARALRAYDRAAALAEAEGTSLALSSRLARARILGTVARRQDEALAEHRAIRAATEDRALGARNLEVWAQLRRRQGRSAEVATLRRWLVEEYPESPQAAEVVWSRGFDAESGGNAETAVRHYETVAGNAPTHARAGQARMRIGQIRISQGRSGEAGRVFEAYLEDFPTGRRWEEASFWAAWTALRSGDAERAQRLLARVFRDSPVSYYAVVGAELLGRPYGLEVPDGEGSEEVGWLREGLRRLDLLVAVGLDDGAMAEERRLVTRARPSPGLTLSLAEALIRRGRTVSGINLGWDVLARGMSWNRRLLGVLYPLPYADLLRREAEEWGVDPVVLAALIRQESAFEADIVSHAGAVGLMQVMPATGRELARTHGPAGFREANLTTPEVNLHLGSAFFVDMSRRYGDLSLVLSAYNAGPTRANRWRRFPEATDPLRFTERIPFQETRGYVKNVRRNMGIYRALYPAG